MKIIFLLLLAAVVAGAVAVYGLIGGASTAPDQDVPAIAPETVVADDEAETFLGTGTLKSLEDIGANVECSISFDDVETGNTVEGTYFVANQNVRGDFVSTVPELGGQVLSSIITDPEMFYSWSEINGEKYGIKMNISTMRSSEANTNTPSQPVSPDTEVAYECTEWNDVDFSIFVPPGDVLFQDFEDIFQAGMEYGTIYEEGEF